MTNNRDRGISVNSLSVGSHQNMTRMKSRNSPSQISLHLSVLENVMQSGPQFGWIFQQSFKLSKNKCMSGAKKINGYNLARF